MALSDTTPTKGSILSSTVVKCTLVYILTFACTVTGPIKALTDQDQKKAEAPICTPQKAGASAVGDNWPWAWANEVWPHVNPEASLQRSAQQHQSGDMAERRLSKEKERILLKDSTASGLTRVQGSQLVLHRCLQTGPGRALGQRTRSHGLSPSSHSTTC